MKKYTVIKNAGNFSNWSQIPSLSIDTYINKPLLPVQASAQLCWDEMCLHVRLTANEPQILARFEDDNSPVCRDSCLEMFLSPIASDSRYFNFEINPNGASFFGFGHGRDDLIRLHPWDIRKLLNVRTFVDEHFWSVCFDVPQSLIQLFFPEFKLQSGNHMRANFYKCGDDIVPEHELIWNPITNGISDFHQPKFFGDLYLE